mgnify:CR=1 FL=1
MTALDYEPVRTPHARNLEVLRFIAASYGFTLDQLKQRDRRPRTCEARNACYAYLRSQGWSLNKIGNYFRRDHTTVLWGLRPHDEKSKIISVKNARARGQR